MTGVSERKEKEIRDTETQREDHMKTEANCPCPQAKGQQGLLAAIKSWKRDVEGTLPQKFHGE